MEQIWVSLLRYFCIKLSGSTDSNDPKVLKAFHGCVLDFSWELLVWQFHKQTNKQKLWWMTGQFLGLYVIDRVPITHLVQWSTWVFATQERKKEVWTVCLCLDASSCENLGTNDRNRKCPLREAVAPGAACGSPPFICVPKFTKGSGVAALIDKTKRTVGKRFDLLREDSESDVCPVQQHMTFEKGTYFSPPLTWGLCWS